MINIISKSRCRYTQSGPKKVVDNLIKGLDLLGYPYVVNRRLDACTRLWIHDDIAALWRIQNLPPEIKVVIGPNLFVKPAQVPKGLDLSRAVFLQPSQWAADFWKTFGFNYCPLQPWPTGIDTNEFTPSPLQKKYILIYYKQRSEVELEVIKKELTVRGLAYKILVYPKYRQDSFKKLLSEARYAIWLGRQESQGIALEEALAAAVPLLVWDVKNLGHWQAPKKEMAQFNAGENSYAAATAAEYFDATCGLKIKSADELPQAILQMENRLPEFRPRDYILKNLSLEKQARHFVEVYQKYFGLTLEAGLSEQVLRQGDWVNRDLFYKSKFLAKDVAKYLKFLIS